MTSSGSGSGGGRDLELPQHRRADHVDRDDRDAGRDDPEQPPERRHGDQPGRVRDQPSRSMIVAFAMPAALAHRLEAVAAAGALELAEQRGHEPAPRAAERVAERDRAAVHVDPARGRGGARCAHASTTRRERLVDLDEVDVVERELRRARAPCAVAGIGAVSMRTGSTPASANVWNRARGVSPSRSPSPRS